MPGIKQYFIGTSGWNYDDWRGPFYPGDWPKRRWFEYYATKFNSVEINATFYRFFKDQTYEKWYQQAPANFVYVLKAPRLITHRKYLKNIEQVANDFMQSTKLLKRRLGLVLLQLAPNTPYDIDRLHQAILAFKNPRKIAVEFRHEKWLNDEVKKLLKKLGVVFVNVDSPKQKLTDWLTSDIGYIRLHGHKDWYNYNYSKRELNNIAKIAKSMSKQGAKKIYIFFNNDAHCYAPKNARLLKELLA